MGYTTNLVPTAAVTILLPLLATLGTYLRFHLRLKNSISIKWDDHFILLSLPLTWTLWIIWLYITTNLIPPNSAISSIPPSNLSTFLLLLWIHNLLNIVAVIFIKLSIILFYLRAFATTRTAKYCLYIVYFLSILQFLMRTVNLLVSCFPVQDTWLHPQRCQSSPSHGRYLHNLTIITESFGLLTEFMLLVYPLPFVWKSHLTVTKKLALCVVFFTGFVTCATQAVRVYVLEMYLYRSSDIGRDVTAPSLVLCAGVETGLGTFVACVVAIWGPVREWIGKVFRKCKGERSLEEGMIGGNGGEKRGNVRGGDELGSGGTMTTGTSTLVGSISEMGSPTISERSGMLSPLAAVESWESRMP
ncbi:hypothetical protein TWF694_011707 [Orbilia ellipsospora]|uniref:Rhodopsin domain-containing protein n=1 Tax=Orbilia ellipsospora TaxID=2528407 RepID=A0AAV9X786_9PEZI